MSSITVKVKWGKENYPDVPLDLSEAPLKLKKTLAEMTGVSPDRQKVMIKGKIIGDDSWDGIPVKDGSQLLMMGQVGDLPSAPVQQVAFVEDMDEDALASALSLPPGLVNLGNTCYANAVMQCLKTIPELRSCLRKDVATLNQGPSNLVTAVHDLFEVMDNEGGTAITPILFISSLHRAFPRFAHKESAQGPFEQQDANEMWVELMRMLQGALKPVEGPGSTSFSSFIDQYLGGTFKVTMKNSECEEEPVVQSTDEFLQLSCFISQDVKYLQSGLKNRLQETITKMSPQLERDATYTRTCQISRLPAYLSVQFVRFHYKEKASMNAKILKDIRFGIQLDTFELCSPELQDRLIPMRTLFKEAEDKALLQVKDKKDVLGGNKKQKVDPSKQMPYSFPEDVGSNNSGYYELQAVLTHKGRSSNSGHYVGWIRQGPGEWFMCDDDSVNHVSEEEILKLSGGGDWHTAYVLLYGPRILERSDEASS